MSALSANGKLPPPGKSTSSESAGRRAKAPTTMPSLDRPVCHTQIASARARKAPATGLASPAAAATGAAAQRRGSSASAESASAASPALTTGENDD